MLYGMLIIQAQSVASFLHAIFCRNMNKTAKRLTLYQ